MDLSETLISLMGNSKISIPFSMLPIIPYFLGKATNRHRSELDVASIDAFCCAVKSDPSSAIEATKLLADRIQSPDPNESLNALNVCDIRCDARP